VYERLKIFSRRCTTFLNETHPDVQLLVTLHGAAEGAIPSICSFGAKVRGIFSSLLWMGSGEVFVRTLLQGRCQFC